MVDADADADSSAGAATATTVPDRPNNNVDDDEMEVRHEVRSHPQQRQQLPTEEHGSGMSSTSSNPLLQQNRRMSSIVIDPSHYAMPLPKFRRLSLSKNSSPSKNGSTSKALLRGPPPPRHHYRDHQLHPVEQLADRLGLSKDHHVTRDALDNYRLLETRVRVGELGKGDTCEGRAACLLWKQLQQQGSNGCSTHAAPTTTTTTTTSSVKVTWDSLAALVGTKSTTLQALHSRITNYLAVEPTTTVATTTPRPTTMTGGIRPCMTTTTSRSTSASSASGPSAAARPAKTTRSGQFDPRNVEAADRQLWASLSIRLQCPAPMIQQAKSLWTALEQHVSHLSNVHERRGYQYDMTRYRSAYQASCLHHVMTSQRSSRRPARESSTTVAASSGKRKRGTTADDVAVEDAERDAEGAPSSGRSSRRTDVEGGGIARAVASANYKLAEFVLPNSFTYLELRQVSKQVAQFVDDMGQLATTTNLTSSGSASASTATMSTAPRGTATAEGHPLRGRSANATGAPSVDSATSTSSGNAKSRMDTLITGRTNKKKRRGDDQARTHEELCRRFPHRRLSHNQEDEMNSNDHGSTTPGLEDHEDDDDCSSTGSNSAMLSKSNRWVDRWLHKLWTESLVVDRDDADAVERMADDVLRRFGLIANDVVAAHEQITPSFTDVDAGDDTNRAEVSNDDVPMTALLTQDFEGDNESTSSALND